MAKSNVRVSAVHVMVKLQSGGGSLTKLIPEAQQKLEDRDRALLQAFCFGLARWSTQLSACVDALLSKPLKQKDADVYWLMQLGVLQLAHMRMADHAAVDTTVAAVKPLGKPWAKGLVNAVLRNYQRQQANIEAKLDEPARLAHPAWLLEIYKKDWPSHWQEIVEQGNQQAPLTLRINVQKSGTEQYQQQLRDAGIESTQVSGVETALSLNTPVQVSMLPGFDKGYASVQDAAAQLAAGILGTGDHKRMLDACAAPGGKTAHALEHGHWQELLAIDNDPTRLERVEQNLQRLQLSDRCVVKCADVNDVSDWWDGKAFDAILLDAPCSGTGVIRRHPDIKLLRREDDIQALVDMQKSMMDALWSTLNSGGRMLYATCSVLKCENEHQVDAFIERHNDASVKPLSLPAGQTRSAGHVQILPGESGMDGFFYALLEKA